MMLRNIQESVQCFLFCLLLLEVSYYFNGSRRGRFWRELH